MWFNENDPSAAEWLRVLIAEGHIPAGVVDERSIEAVQPSDCPETSHFFAGIGGWSYALKLAGWPEGTPVWTGSCPCQPFSSAGKRKGTKDPRHLWPVWRGLIEKCRPAVVFGEQVASPLGREWLSGVRSDLEALGYEVGAADLCAAGVGAPHIRQRLFWVAESEPIGRRRRSIGYSACQREGIQSKTETQRSSIPRGMVFSDRKGRESREPASETMGHRDPAISTGSNDRMGDTISQRDEDARQREAFKKAEGMQEKTRKQWIRLNPWESNDTISCLDGKSRRIEPSIQPLAHGIPARVGLLRGYGNAITPQIAATFIKAYIEARQ